MVDRITWGAPGEKVFETGVDRGVLYPMFNEDGTPALGVAWNGLTAVDEDFSDGNVDSYYYDGNKYLDTRSPSDFSASLKAWTYPDEFLRFDGIVTVNPGFMVASQPIRDTFGLTYRTRVGSDLDQDLGYKIHLCYNLTAQSDNRGYLTIGNNPSPSDFGWKITGVPVAIPGIRPTAHVILDSRGLDKNLLYGLEDILYGYSPGAEGEGKDILDGGDPFTSFTTISLLEVDAGWPYSATPPVIDGGDPTKSSDAPPPLGPPGPRLPTLDELATIIQNYVPV